ncbi:major histocompatibility complex class I-related gene protein-like isoform X2 [Hemiscyllium ocellatum]|uniref:major histocompatibility complex class I-related gene protein-like isoform X2 n=1 Tax=Hemiscyllium ocellatum TaxID=170820 RepID=UPI0029673763|nr:major histocompatibility complex class I-related gene protein-like isoform X2 [Hemiscyllium ocellatum]
MIGLLVLGLLCGKLCADPAFPQFVIVGYVDGVQFVTYDSDQKNLIPREQWMVVSEGPEAWKRKLSLAREQERNFKNAVLSLKSRNNQTDGIHTYQMMTGCDLSADGMTSGFNQYGWDGQDILSLDKNHMVWVTPVSWGESIKNRWDQDVVDNQRWKHYLDVECIDWLKRYLEYGQRQLKVVPPDVSFTSLGDSNWLSCLVTGFYPQAIEVTLWRDEVLIDETLSTGILPNHNRTYQIRKWVGFNPEDQAEYSCQVEHSGLEETLVVIYVPTSRSQVPMTVWILLGVVGIVALAVAAVFIYKKKEEVKNSYDPTNTDDRTPSDGSANT